MKMIYRRDMKSLFKIIFAIIALFGVSSCDRNEAIDSLSNARTLKLTVEAIENNRDSRFYSSTR